MLETAVEHAYPRRLLFGSILVQDVLLALVCVTLVTLRPSGAFAHVLGVAAPLVLVWGALTLHFPSRVVMSEAGISFHRYGRAHRFAWSDVQSIRVRRFLVRDRVLVRIVPSPPWRGRYWILDGIERFEELVRSLEARTARPAGLPRA
jgi:hypothetical protein